MSPTLHTLIGPTNVGEITSGATLLNEAIEELLQKHTNYPSVLRYALDVLASCPSAGGGVHHWLWTAALKLHPIIPHKADLVRCLTLGMSECGRPPHYHEVEDAVYNSIGKPTKRPENQSRTETTIASADAAIASDRNPPWPKMNQNQIAAIVKSGPDLAALSDRSPVCVMAGKLFAEDIVGQLFRTKSIICAGWTQQKFSTAPIEDFRKFHLFRQMQFIVPSPMSARLGRKKQDNALSAHTLDNTGPRRFLICEFDTGTADGQAALISHLAQSLPLALVVHSGGKSCHSWFFVEGRTEKDLRTFMHYAVSLGADKATWLKSQFVRIPGGLRENGKRQVVHYFNPSVIQGR
jgi:hypothetical protein